MITPKQTTLLLTLAIFSLTACNNANKEPNTNNLIASVDTTTTIKDTIIANLVTKIDSIVYVDISFPVDSSFTTKVLTVGTFHGDEVWENADKGKWFGLFKNKTSYYIAETKLKTIRVNDVVVDENENEKSGWEVNTLHKDSSIILIEGLNYLNAHTIQQAVLPKLQIFPTDTMRINYLGNDYKIFATGGFKKGVDDVVPSEVWNYELYMTAIINGQQLKSLLVAQPNFEDHMINLIFAGDIDGDGILDLIIDTSRHYNATSPTIYLSKPADKGEVVKPIGGHTSVGC